MTGPYRCQVTGNPAGTDSYTVVPCQCDVCRLSHELATWRPLTNEEAQKAFDEAVAVPFSEEQIAKLVKKAMDPAERLPNSEQAQLAAEVQRLKSSLAEYEEMYGEREGELDESNAIIELHDAEKKKEMIEVALKRAERIDELVVENERLKARVTAMQTEFISIANMACLAWTDQATVKATFISIGLRARAAIKEQP